MNTNYYNTINNPINDDNNLKEIVNLYSNNNNFYHALTGQFSKNYRVEGRNNLLYLNSLYVNLFNTWKNNIYDYYSRISNHDVEKKKTVKALINYIRGKNPKTYEQVKNIMSYKSPDDEYLRDALFIYSFCNFDSHRYWSFMQSRKVNATGVGISNSDVEHRLYLNCDSDCIHLIADEFIRRCNEKNIPYYFKFREGGTRDDSIVIYTPTKYFDEYVKILNNIRAQNNLYNKIHKPPVVSGNLYGFIGYGSAEDEEAKESFNSGRAKILEDCIRNTTKKTIKECLNLTIKDSSRVVSTYNDYLIRKLIQYLKDKIVKRNNNTLSSRDIYSDEFDNAIRRGINNNIEKVLDSSYIDIPYKGTTIGISYLETEWLIKKQAPFLYDSIGIYKDNLRKEIKNTSEELGIDPDNFCFDIDRAYQLGKGKKQVRNLRYTNNINGYDFYTRGNPNKQDTNEVGKRYKH